MKLVVGFITYNESSLPYLSYFLPSLRSALEFLKETEYQVLVFDNSRADYSLNRLAITSFGQLLPGRVVQLDAAGDNLGFSRAYNILINKSREAGAQYFLMINPDTLFEPDSIAALVKTLDHETRLASVSPKIKRWDFINQQKTEILDSVGLALRPGLKFIDLGQGETDRGQFDQHLILGPSGAAGMFRLSALEKIKEGNQYFDERFFMYKEDCDLNYRLALAGQLSRLVPEAIIYHDRTAAREPGIWQQITNRRQKSKIIRSWSFLNQHLIFVKHWQRQNYLNKLIIIWRGLIYLFFSLILEQYNLKNYLTILRLRKVLTNIK